MRQSPNHFTKTQVALWFANWLLTATSIQLANPWAFFFSKRGVTGDNVFICNTSPTNQPHQPVKTILSCACGPIKAEKHFFLPCIGLQAVGCEWGVTIPSVAWHLWVNEISFSNKLMENLIGMNIFISSPNLFPRTDSPYSTHLKQQQVSPVTWMVEGCCFVPLFHVIHNHIILTNGIFWVERY